MHYGTVRCSSQLGGGVSAWPGVFAFCLVGGVHSPPWTDTCENITFPQILLRMVKIYSIVFLETLYQYGY